MPQSTVVIAAVIGEREYQKQRWPESKQGIGSWITITRQCLDKAHNAPTSEEALHELRQVAAVAIAAMEEHGVCWRHQPISKTGSELRL